MHERMQAAGGCKIRLGISFGLFFLSVIFNGHHSGNACDLINKGRKKKRKEKETEIMRGKRGEKVRTREKKQGWSQVTPVSRLARIDR